MLRKIVFVLPLFTALVTVLNSGAFVFLVADERLAFYIACSSIYSLISWVTNWIVPSIYGFREDKLPEIRLLQVALAILCAALLNLLFPGPIARAFTFAVLAEIFFFNSGLLVIHSKTAVFHALEISRGVLNVGNLALCVFLFGGEPSYFVVGMGVCVIFSGLASYYLGNRAPSIAPAQPSLRAFTSAARATLQSRNTRLMLAARGLELGMIITLTFLEALPALIAIKLAVMTGQAVSLNARAVTWPYILAFATCFLAAALSSVIVLNGIWPSILPEALGTLTWGSLLIALAFQAPFVVILCLSLVQPAQVSIADAQDDADPSSKAASDTSAPLAERSRGS